MDTISYPNDPRTGLTVAPDSLLTIERFDQWNAHPAPDTVPVRCGYCVAFPAA